MKDFDRILPIKRAAEGRLFAIPGVHAVGIGCKLVAGQRTEEPAIMVFVEKKRAVSELRPEQVIPPEIDNVKTDVYESEITRVVADTTKYRPLIGGSQMTPGGLTPGFKVTDQFGGPPKLTPAIGLGTIGTIGCIAKTGETTPRILAITCQHVVAISPSAQPPSLSANAVMPQITFTGNNAANSIVVVTLGVTGSKVASHVFYRTSAIDNLNSIANTIASRISGLPGAGLSATPSGAQVTIQGASLTGVNCQVFGPHADNTWADIHASISDNVVSLTGKASDACAAYVNVNVGAAQPSYGVFVPIASGATASTVAKNIAKAINDRNLPDDHTLPRVAATETDPVNPGDAAKVTFTGTQEIECDVSSDVRVGQAENSFCSKCSKCCDDRIGTIVDARLELDVALIQLDPNYVDKYRAEVADIGPITGMHDIYGESAGYPLKIRGAKTGQIKPCTLLALDLSGLAIFPDEDNHPPQWLIYHRFFTQAFSMQGTSVPGDSGAAVLTNNDPPHPGTVKSNNEIAGIVFGAGGTTCVATTIQQIIGAFPQLNLSVATATAAGIDQPVPKLSPAASRAQQPETADLRPAARLAQAQQEITSTPAGRKYNEVVQRHLPEVQTLVNNNKRVAAVWHRNGGPEIARHVLRMSDFPEEPLPPEINGRPLSDCLDDIRRSFSRYGSPALASDLAEYGAPLSALAGLSYREALDRLRALELD